jgi:hypothetical protein
LKKIVFFWVDDIIKKAFESSKMEIKAIWRKFKECEAGRAILEKF